MEFVVRVLETKSSQLMRMDFDVALKFMNQGLLQEFFALPSSVSMEVIYDPTKRVALDGLKALEEEFDQTNKRIKSVFTFK